VLAIAELTPEEPSIAREANWTFTVIVRDMKERRKKERRKMVRY
jgi:hypothetical protein